MEIHYNTIMDSHASEPPKPEPPPDPEPRTVPRDHVTLIPPPAENIWLDEPRPVVYRRPRTRLALILFLLTCLSTFAVGFLGDAVPGQLVQNLLHGLEY